MTIKVPENLIRQGINELGSRVGNLWRRPRNVRLGHPADSSLLYVPNTNETQVYIHGLGENPSSFSVMNATSIPKDNRIWGMGISIRQTESGAWKYDGQYVEYDEKFSAGIAGNQPQTKIDISQIDYGTAHPYSGLILFIRGAMYGNNWVDDQFTADFSTGTVQDTAGSNITIPTTNNRMKAILIQVDPSTGTLSYKQSSELQASISMVEAYKNSLLPLPDSSSFRVCYAKLVKGITSFSRIHLWTVPEFLTKGDGSFPISLDYALTIASNTQRVTGAFTIASGGSLTVNGRLTVI